MATTTALPPPADFSDLQLDGHERALEAIDKDRLAGFTQGGMPESPGGRGAEPPPVSWRSCRCAEPRPNGDVELPGCAICGRTIRQTNGSKPATQPEPWTDDQLDQLRKLWKLRGSASWRIADMVLALIPLANGRERNGANARVRSLAQAIGGEYRTLKAYRQTAHCWPPAHRVEQATFAAHVNWTAGGAAEAADRADVLRRLADEHGTVTVEHVKAQRNNSTPVGGAKLLDRLRRLEREFTRVDDFGECGPEALMNGAARARAIADRLEQLAA